MKKILIAIGVLLLALLIPYLLFPGWILKTMTNYTISSGDFHKEEVMVNGKVCHYLDNHRTDKQTLVLLHGFSDRKESWFPFVNKFTKEYRILLPDLLGHGENVRDTSVTYSFDRQAAFVHDYLNTLQVTDFHLIGISMGGGVAGVYAAEYPEELRSVTFISPANIAGCSEKSELDLFMLGFDGIEEKKANFPLLPEKFTSEVAADFKKYVFHKKIFAPNHLFSHYIQQVIDHREFNFSILQDIVDVDSGEFLDPMNEEMTRITSPALVIWGKQDPLLSVSCSDKLVNLLPGEPTEVLIDDCGHATIAEQPQKTFEAMHDFLKRFE